MGSGCSTNGYKRSACMLLVGRLKRSWMDNIKEDLRETRWTGISISIIGGLM
jgi:hypothetical protein